LVGGAYSESITEGVLLLVVVAGRGVNDTTADDDADASDADDVDSEAADGGLSDTTQTRDQHYKRGEKKRDRTELQILDPLEDLSCLHPFVC